MPAVTMVAAWMSAETGVGPSIASGSHVWSGSWADLATAPSSRRYAATSTQGWSVFGSPAKTPVYVTWCVCRNRTNVARIMPMSPMTFITNALRAATTAAWRQYQKPISR